MLGSFGRVLHEIGESKIHLPNVMKYGVLVECYEWGRHTRTRREYVRVGLDAASMPHTVRECLPHSPRCQTESFGK
jgi:hypothetical protein